MFVTGFDGQGEYVATVESHELFTAKGSDEIYPKNAIVIRFAYFAFDNLMH